MADIKDTVASHISSGWDAAVVGGSGSVPTVDAVGPEDIIKPEDYPEAILVYNDVVTWDRLYNQHQYGDRHTRVYILVTAHTKSGCTKTHFRNFVDELKSVMGSAISGYDNQVLDPEENVSRTKGVQGGMYQAQFVLHLYEYGVSVSSAAGGGAAGTTIWAEPLVAWQASANLSNERLLQLTATDTVASFTITSSLTLTGATITWPATVGINLADLDDVTVTGTQLEDLVGFGSGNPIEFNCPFIGSNPDGTLVPLTAGPTNTGGTDGDAYFQLVIPEDRGGLSLTLTHITVDVYDGDNGDYITAMYAYALKHNGFITLHSSATNVGFGGAETVTEALTNGTTDVSGYKNIIIRLQCVLTNANDLDISGVTLRGYYS